MRVSDLGAGDPLYLILGAGIGAIVTRALIGIENVLGKVPLILSLSVAVGLTLGLLVAGFVVHVTELMMQSASLLAQLGINSWSPIWTGRVG